MEVTGGFEPPKKGFANLPIRPLWHVTSHERNLFLTNRGHWSQRLFEDKVNLSDLCNEELHFVLIHEYLSVKNT